MTELFDYHEWIHEQIDLCIEKNTEDRKQRISEVNELLETYVERVGKRPPSYELNRLTDYILKEELTDKSTNKSKEEDAFISNDQLRHREKKEVRLQNIEETVNQNGQKQQDGKVRKK